MGGLALARHGNVRGALGFGSEYCRRFRFASYKHCSFVVSFCFRWIKTAHTSTSLSDFLQVWGNPAHITRYYLNVWFSCPALQLLYMQEGKFLFLKGSLELLGAQNDSQCPVPSTLHTLPHSPLSAFSCLSPSVLPSFWPTDPTPATFCQPYSSQWSIITFLCSHWWLLEGAALCCCSNWNHNLCSNEYLSRVHNGKWGSVNPKSLQKLTGKGWLAGVIYKWWILPRTKLLCIISLHITFTF